MKYKKQSDETKRIFRKVETGVPGVYTGFTYKIRKLILPALIVTAFLCLSFFCVSNVLYSSGALKVNKISVFCSDSGYRLIHYDNMHRANARAVKVISDTETFCSKISVHKCSDAQLNAILAKYGVHAEADEVRYIIVNENNELVEYYTSIDLRPVLKILAELGYLEVKNE